MDAIAVVMVMMIPTVERAILLIHRLVIFSAVVVRVIRSVIAVGVCDDLQVPDHGFGTAFPLRGQATEQAQLCEQDENGDGNVAHAVRRNA